MVLKPAQSLRGTDLLGLDELTRPQIQSLLALATEIKREPARFRDALAGRSLAMLFQKPSTRTRVSFQVGMAQLGGTPVVLNQDELQLGRGESIADTAAVLSRYVDGIMARVFDHSDLEMLAEHATVPIINGLSDALHPCQALCDFLTMGERFGELAGLRMAYIGDGNNMVHSLANGAAKLGVELAIATPTGYEPDAAIIGRAQEVARGNGAGIMVTTDPRAAARGAHVLYTDVWTSMGQDDERAQRLADFRGYEINAALFADADPDAVLMHCLPAHRGEEVTADVADGPRSIIFDQAENRLHAQKAVLVALMG